MWKGLVNKGPLQGDASPPELVEPQSPYQKSIPQSSMIDGVVAYLSQLLLMEQRVGWVI